MRLSRFLAGVLAALLSVALVGSAPVHARVPVADPLATTVTGACAGGPGRLSLKVHPPAGGSYRVEITARGLAEGSRWSVPVVQESETNSEAKEFRRIAVEGGWTVVTRFPASAAPERVELFFLVGARQRGDRGHRCLVLNLPSSPVLGLAECNHGQFRFIYLFARELDDGSTLVRSLFAAAPDSQWHLRLAANGAASRQVVEFDDRAGRRGVVKSRVVLTGVKDPRLRLVATNANGRRCFIGVDPPNVTTDAPLKLKGLAKLGASLS